MKAQTGQDVTSHTGSTNHNWGPSNDTVLVRSWCHVAHHGNSQTDRPIGFQNDVVLCVFHSSRSLRLSQIHDNSQVLT
jgi:hypothetical protein